jgi:hypothetical protein
MDMIARFLALLLPGKNALEGILLGISNLP